MKGNWVKQLMTGSVLTLVLAFGTTAFAQMMGHPGMMEGMGKREGMRHMMGMPGYGGGPFDVEMFRDYLQLSDDQVAKLRKIRSDYRKEMIKRRANMKVAELELWELIDRKDLDMGKAEKKVKEISAMKADLMMYRLKALQETKKFLTDDQFEMFREMGFRTMRGMMGRHGMSGGMMPGHMGRGMMGEDYE